MPDDAVGGYAVGIPLHTSDAGYNQELIPVANAAPTPRTLRPHNGRGEGDLAQRGVGPPVHPQPSHKPQPSSSVLICHQSCMKAEAERCKPFKSFEHYAMLLITSRGYGRLYSAKLVTLYSSSTGGQCCMDNHLVLTHTSCCRSSEANIARRRDSADTTACGMDSPVVA